jgi:hypothetical protein
MQEHAVEALGVLMEIEIEAGDIGDEFAARVRSNIIMESRAQSVEP